VVNADEVEAVRRRVVEDSPVLVVNDLHGGDLYREDRERWRSGTRRESYERRNHRDGVRMPDGDREGGVGVRS
jgi:hypothetical protein